MTGIIYCHTNILNNKKYIGQTTSTLEGRSKKGFGYLLDGNKETHTKFANSIRKYGWENFKHEVLEVVEAETKEELIQKLNELEIFYIQKFNTLKNGYNCDAGGNNKNCSEEAKKKLSEYHLGKKLNIETRKKLSESHKGKITINNGEKIKHVSPSEMDYYLNEGWVKGSLPVSEETKNKIRNTLKGNKLSEKTKLKMSLSHKGSSSWIKGKHHSEETKEKIRKANKGKNPYIKTQEIKDKIRNTLLERNKIKKQEK